MRSSFFYVCGGIKQVDRKTWWNEALTEATGIPRAKFSSCEPLVKRQQSLRKQSFIKNRCYGHNRNKIRTITY